MAIVGLLFRKILTFMKWFFIISIVSVILFRFIPIPITPTMLYLLGEQAFDSERKVVLKKDWESLSNISPNMKLAVIAAEDQLFYEHFGFDFAAIRKAIRNNEKGRRLKGGSTISQQTAKNAFLLPHRSYMRKGLEAYFTILIELLWSKDRIVEVYLNVIEFGNGIYGVEAAAQHFFKKPASKLTKDEAALLAAVLPNPIRFKVDNPSSYVLRRKNWIKRQIGRMGLGLNN
ncbi:MAG: monofunctional biosynthetic peptidoglycan transglycosylase [Chitinophagales bacterium]|jgi:monofunctional biosynthetic peptidoglycan transglycosylase